MTLGAYYMDHHITGDRYSQSFMETARGELFKQWIGVDKKVLDIGGRDGQLTRYFAGQNDVLILDVDPFAVAMAKSNGFSAKCFDLAHDLPFVDDLYDVVVMAEVLEHLPVPHLVLDEVRRVLRPGGLFIGSVPLAYHLLDRYRVLRGKKLLSASDPTHLQFFTYDELEGLLLNYFAVDELHILKGGKGWKAKFPSHFARNVAFKCIKE